MSVLYSHSPVVVVEKWSDVDTQQKLLKFKPNTVNRDVVMVDYWLDRIQNEKDKYEGTPF